MAKLWVVETGQTYPPASYHQNSLYSGRIERIYGVQLWPKAADGFIQVPSSVSRFE